MFTKPKFYEVDLLQKSGGYRRCRKQGLKKVPLTIIHTGLVGEAVRISG